MMPCNIIAGLFGAFVSACMGPDLSAVSGIDMTYILLQGMGVLGVGFILLTLAPSYIPAPEVSLYTLVETVLGPVWVYLGGYEAPSVYAIAGGVILLAALTVHGYVDWWWWWLILVLQSIIICVHVMWVVYENVILAFGS